MADHSAHSLAVAQNASRASNVDAFLAALDDNLTQAVTGAPSAHDHSAHDHSSHVHSTGSSSHAGHVSSHDAHAGHVMKMWFHGGVDEVILFDWWRVDSCSGMLFSCLLIFVMGAAYEGIKWFRVYLQMTQSARENAPTDNGIGLSEIEQAPLQCKLTQGSQDDVYNPTTTPPSRRTDVKRASPFTSVSAFSGSRLLQSFMYIIQLVLAYWLMLIVMTYNSYLTAAVILGAGFGHWLFAVLKLRSAVGESKDSFATDACH